MSGAVLGAIAVGALVWALVEGPEVGFGSADRRRRLRAGGVAFAAFIVVESRVAEPMMPLSLFRIRELSVANLATFFVYAALGQRLFFVVLFATVGARLLADARPASCVAPDQHRRFCSSRRRFGRAADRSGRVSSSSAVPS